MTRLPCPAILTLVALAPLPVHADVRCLQTRSISSPSLRALAQAAPPEGRASLAQQGIGKPAILVTSIRGNSLRRDIGPVSLLFTPGPVHAAGPAPTLTGISQIYCTQVDRKARSFHSLPYVMQGVFGSSANTPVGQRTCDVLDTGERKKLLGHPARLYHITIHVPDQGLTYNGIVWAADDLPPAPAYADERDPMAVAEHQFAKIPGLVLIASIRAAGGSGGDISLDMETQRLSTAPLPPETFTIPSGFTGTNPDASAASELRRP